MTHADDHPLETLLRLCAARDPEPWYPREYAKASGVPWEALAYYLEYLWLEGLVQKAPGAEPGRSGLVLSDKGRRVLQDPDALRRLREGAALDPADRGAVVRQAIRSPAAPVVTRLLLAANVLVFGYGLYLAYSQGPAVVQGFLAGFGVNDPRVSRILHQTGSVAPADVLRGEWWRLLACCFVHLGLLHLGMNMYMLYALGRYVESMWGHLRFLVLYLYAGLGGSLLAMAMSQGQGLVGASGALCGVLAAEGVWVLLNGHHFPKAQAARWRSVLGNNILMIVFISLFPQVSGWGHLGGAVGGALAALLLHAQRFGPAPARWLALAGLLLLPWLGWLAFERARPGNPVWQGAQEREFDRGSKDVIGRLMDDVRKFDEAQLEPLLIRHPSRRDPEAVDRALAALPARHKELAGLVAALDQVGPLGKPEAEAKRQAAREWALAEKERLTMVERCLRAGAAWTPGEEEALQRQEEKVKNLRRRWN